MHVFIWHIGQAFIRSRSKDTFDLVWLLCRWWCFYFYETCVDLLMPCNKIFLKTSRIWCSCHRYKEAISWDWNQWRFFKRIQNSTQNDFLWTMVFGLANKRGVYSFLNSSATRRVRRALLRPFCVRPSVCSLQFDWCIYFSVEPGQPSYFIIIYNT